MEVPTIYKAYVSEYHHKIWPYMVQYLHFRILKFPLNMEQHIPKPSMVSGLRSAAQGSQGHDEIQRLCWENVAGAGNGHVLGLPTSGHIGTRVGA